MKKSKVMLSSALILGASALSGANTFAAPNIPGLKIINDRNPVQYQQTDGDSYGVNLVVKFEADPEIYNNQETNSESRDIKNPDTIDAMAVVLGVAGVCLALFVLSLVLNTRKRGSIKPRYFAVFFGILTLVSSLTAVSSKAIHATEAGGNLAEGFVRIENKELYDVLKKCFAENKCKVIKDSTENVEFDDETQSISHPEIVEDLYLDGKYTGVKLSDVNDLSIFTNSKWIYLGNNNITDISVFTQENFPGLRYLTLHGNHIESFASIMESFGEKDPVHDDDKLSQSFNYKFDENGEAKLPRLLKEIIETEHVGYSYQMTVHIYNLEVRDDFESVKILDTNKDAYFVATIAYYPSPK